MNNVAVWVILEKHAANQDLPVLVHHGHQNHVNPVIPGVHVEKIQINQVDAVQHGINVVEKRGQDQHVVILDIFVFMILHIIPNVYLFNLQHKLIVAAK